jgi:hypothetical protein
LPPSFESAGAPASAPTYRETLPSCSCGTVEPVLAAEREQEVVARHARDRLRLEAEELPDSVVFVYDVVAGAEVGEALERAAPEAALARGAAAEDLVVGQEDEAEVAPDEAAPRGSNREQQLRLLRQLLARLEHARLDAARRFCVRSASPRCGNATTTRWPGADERRELALGLGETARGDRRASAPRRRAAGSAGTGSSSLAPSSDGASTLSSSQTRRTASGSKTKSGGPASAATRSSGTGTALVPVFRT